MDHDARSHPVGEPRASGTAGVLATVMLGLAELLEPRPPRDLGAEVVDAPTDEPDLALTFGPLEPLT
jgi:hypothetical protein